MKRIVKLTESDLVNLVEKVLSESKQDIKKEIESKIKSLKSVGEIKDYYDELNDTYGSSANKLVLIFPKSSQLLFAALGIAIGGINAQVFVSVQDCIDEINKLANKGRKYQQIYVGSHGGGQEGLLTSAAEGDNTSLFGGFSATLKRVVIPNSTKIAFSACEGARFKHFMIKFAAQTQTEVYGCDGDYDWTNNTCEGKFWACNYPTENDLLELRIMGKGTINVDEWCRVTNSIPFSWD